ncbi:hypothetical protein ACQRBK_06590 [Peptoniphilaceae bacterium SGI.137]|nr:hypothetical protein [Peptoniphilaceae bacterium]
MTRKVEALTGNETVAQAIMRINPDLIAIYPITPQSSSVESIASKVSNGEMDSELIQVESELTSMSMTQGAALAGGRVFTSTSGNGLHLMFEPYTRQSTLRLPMLMTLATRELMSPHTVFSGQQDVMLVRDAGWIQCFASSNQELFDLLIQAYRIAEHKNVLLPINVCYDGFYLSHLSERVELLDKEEVQNFVGKFELKHLHFDPENVMSVDPLTSGPRLIKFRESHLKAMQDAIPVIENIDKEFGEKFGRSYGGMVEQYQMDDAEIVIVTIGAHSGAAKVAIKAARKEGIKVGLLRVRFMRPFPAKKIQEVLADKKGYAVIDRSVSFGWNAGPVFVEVNAAMANTEKKKTFFSAIGGLGGADITVKNIYDTILILEKESREPQGRITTMWYE